MEKKINLIKKSLEKKKENIIVDLFIKDYDKSNFYIALVFNKTIDKYKVLFVPLDAIDKGKVDEYFCYQFIFVDTVNYLLEIINNEERCNDLEFRNRQSKTLNSYYIEINTYINNNYKYITNQFLPKDWLFLFEVVVVLFEHCPNIISELCNNILIAYSSDSTIIKYDYSLNLDLFKSSLGEIEDTVDVSFLEKINGKYFAIVNDNLFILEYNNFKKILNIYCDNKELDNYNYVFNIILNIRNNIEKKFYKLGDSYTFGNNYYLCYGISSDSFKIVSNNSSDLMSLDRLIDGSIKIIGDGDKTFESDIKTVLKNKLSNKKIDLIIKDMYY